MSAQDTLIPELPVELFDLDKQSCGHGLVLNECSDCTPRKQQRKIVNKKVHFPCDFCGKFSNELEILIKGPLVGICGECVDMCTEIVAEERIRKFSPEIQMLRDS